MNVYVYIMFGDKHIRVGGNMSWCVIWLIFVLLLFWIKLCFILRKKILCLYFVKILLICLINFTYAVALVLEMSQFAQNTLF